ncbi:unnamed protein product, partial [marine sediment metagenome]
LGFYNSVGGALSDMIAHLMQPLRAISGYASAAEMLSNLRIRGVQRAQYRVGPSVLASRERPFVGEYTAQDADNELLEDTETFGVVELQFIAGDWTNVDVLIRTGKGVWPESKVLKVYGSRTDEGIEVVTFNIAEKYFQVGVEVADEQGTRIEPIMKSEEFHVRVNGGEVTTDAEEYVVIFKGLCGWWTPDPRYFPPVSEAAKVYEFFRSALVRERFSGAITTKYDAYGGCPL